MNFTSPVSTPSTVKLCLTSLLVVLALLALLMPVATTPNAVAQETQPNPTPRVEATVTPTVTPTRPPCGNTP